MKKYDFYCYLKPNKLFGQPNRFLIFSVSKLYLWPYLSSLLFLGHLHVPGKVLGSWPVSSLTWVDACMRAKSLQSGSTLCDPITVAHQAPLSMEFFWQEYWSGLPFPSPWDLPNPGIEPVSLLSPALQVSSFTTSATWEAMWVDAATPILALFSG